MIRLTARQDQARVSLTGYKGLFLNFEYPAPSGDVQIRIWNGVGTVTDEDGNRWLGQGDSLAFSGLRLAERTKVNNLAFTLSNAPKDQAVIEAGVDVSGRKGKLSEGYISPERRIIDGLIVRYEFTCNNIELGEATDTSTLILNANAGFLDFIPTNLLWSKAAQDARIKGDEYQEQLFPNQPGVRIIDTGFNEMSRIRDSLDIVWKAGPYDGRDPVQLQYPSTLSGSRDKEPSYTDIYHRRRAA